MQETSKRNRLTFGLGTIGRDMVFSLISIYLIYYLTDTRWGKFKPWIAAGVLLTSSFTILIFTDFRLEGTSFIVMFAVFYILWDINFTANDIS